MTSCLWAGGRFLIHFSVDLASDRSLCWLFDHLNDLEGLLIETVDALHVLVSVSRSMEVCPKITCPFSGACIRSAQLSLPYSSNEEAWTLFHILVASVVLMCIALRFAISRCSSGSPRRLSCCRSCCFSPTPEVLYSPCASCDLDRSLCWLFDHLNDLEGLLIETVDALHVLVSVSRWCC
ncbi:hypothetical protein FHG87_011105 [Trinorchestia longiramus]|nr:hypothetical protein FHG87_011105 [Trinorchestia longiramus]